MKRILNIALKDIRQILRDKMTFLFLLIMPVGFTFLFGFAFGGLGRGDQDQRLAVGLFDRDGSDVSEAFRGLLQTNADIRVVMLEESAGSVEAIAANGDYAAVVIVPEGFGSAYAAGQQPRLQLAANPSDSGGMIAQNAVQRAAWQTASAAAASLAAGDAGANQFRAGFNAAYSRWLEPPVSLEVAQETAESGVSGLMTVSHTAPAMMIQFALAGLLTAAQVLVQERKARCMQRLLTTRAQRHEILAGHFLAIFLVIFTQFVLLIVFGQIILNLDYLAYPAHTLLMMLATALFVAALGLLIGALARSDEQAVIFAMAPMFVLSALGGAWLPLEATGEAFRAAGSLTPVALALDGFKAILGAGAALQSILLPASVLVGYALVCVGLAVWKFRFE